MKKENLIFEVNINTKKAMKQIRELKLEIARLQHPARGVDWRMVGEIIVAFLIVAAGIVLLKMF
jgi:hypothetical protein